MPKKIAALETDCLWPSGFSHTHKKKELNQAQFVKHLGCVRVLADLHNQSQ